MLGATLTSLGNPLVGEDVEFYLGTPAGALLCTSETDSFGVVNSAVDTDQAAAVDQQGYAVVFGGNQGLLASTDTWVGAQSIVGGSVPTSTSTTTTTLSGA